MAYHYCVRDAVLQYIREQRLLHAGERVAVAVSGGADSVALLRVLLELRPELGVVLAVAHFNHGLRGEQSAADQAFVAELAREHELEFFAGHGEVREHAAIRKLSLEAAGRKLRYQWLVKLSREQRFDAIATAHTQDDQAETVLLKLLRGAGTRGLAGIYPILAEPRIIRPLLCISRAEVEAYLASLGQSWREDESNLDRRFLRNRVRHELMPLLEGQFNPNIRQVLSDLAELSRAEEEYWDEAVERHLSARAGSQELSLAGFAQVPLALQRRVLKRFAESRGPALDFAHVEMLRRCASSEVRKAELPGGRLAVNTQGFLKLCAPQPQSPRDYRYVLPVPGEVEIAELGLTLRAVIVPEAFARELPPGALLNRDLIGPELTVRNWQPGDRFHPAHHRSEEKLKRLFADERIPAEQRATLPLALHDDDIVWAQGFPVASAYQWSGEGDAVRIEVY